MTAAWLLVAVGSVVAPALGQHTQDQKAPGPIPARVPYKPVYDEPGPSRSASGPSKMALPSQPVFKSRPQDRIFPSTFSPMKLPTDRMAGSSGHGSGRFRGSDAGGSADGGGLPILPFPKHSLDIVPDWITKVHPDIDFLHHNLPGLIDPEPVRLTQAPPTGDAPLRLLHGRDHLNPQLQRTAEHMRQLAEDAEPGSIMRKLSDQLDDAAAADRARAQQESRCSSKCSPYCPPVGEKTNVIGEGAQYDSRLHASDDADAASPVRTGGQGAAPTVESLSDLVKANPEDFASMRALALSQLGTRHPSEAARTMARAYESDPLLSREPLDRAALGLTATRLSSLTNAARVSAAKSGTSDAWLLVTVLEQAQGKNGAAIAALETSRKAGLNADVGDWMITELRKAADHRGAQGLAKH